MFNVKLAYPPKSIDLLKENRLKLFRETYDENINHIRKTIYWSAGPEFMDDLAQETFLKAWKNFDRFKGKSSIQTWLHRIAVNVAIDHLRKKVPDPVENIPETYVSESREIEELIEKGVAALSEKHRICFVLYYKIGFTKEEVAQIQKIPLGTVKSRLHTAKGQFVEFLAENGVSYE